MQRTVIFNKRTRRLLNAALSIFMTLGLSILPVLSAVLPPATSVGAISNGFTVTVAPATAGAQAAYTIDMVAGENYAAADTLTFTFPSGSIVPAGALTSTTVLADAVTPPTTSKALTSVTGDNAARTVVIILNAAITMGHNIRVQFGFNAGIKNPISTGSVSLTVAANTAGNGADKTGSPFSGSYTLQQVSVASFAAGTTVAGSTTNYTFDFTPRNDIPGNGKIEFIFPTTPDTYGLGGAVAASSPNGTIDGTFSVAAGVCTGTANSSAICISRLNTGTATTPGGTVQLQLTNIRNPRISGGLYPLTSGLTGQFGIKTYDGGGGNRDVNLSAGTTTITAAAITSPNDQKTGGGSLQAGAADTTNRLTVSGTIVNPAPAGGQVVINFPKAANDTQVDFNPGSVVLADIVTKTFNGTDIGAITLVSATNNQIIIQSTAGFNAGATSASLVFEINKVRAPRNMANQTTGTTAGTTTTVGTDWSMYTRSSATNVIDYVNTGFPVLTPTNGVLPLSVGTAGTAGTGTPTINFTASSVVTTGVAATVTFATVQALAMIAAGRRDDPGGRPYLVVAPTSVVGNWQAEAARFLPG
ncbi:MAG: hypothetical protein NTZ05_14060, partial [Chloroflexi bacterium]|nr:hypothetical protein [Chloroflexota bacterium]